MKKEDLTFQNLKPGVCVPWEVKEKEFETVHSPELVKGEWEKIDMFGYLYIWSWVHR